MAAIITDIQAIQDTLRTYLEQSVGKDSAAWEEFHRADEFAKQVKIGPDRLTLKELDIQADLETEAFPHALWKAWGDHDFLGTIIEKKYGGNEKGYLAEAITNIQFARYSGGATMSRIANLDLFARQTGVYGTEEQKEKYLPGITAGTKIGALSMTEPLAGSDIVNMMEGTIKPSEDTQDKLADNINYIANATKKWTTNGGRFDENGQAVTADYTLIYAVSAEAHEHKTGKRRLGAFFAEKGDPGFDAEDKIYKRGMKISENWITKLDNYEVDPERILHKIHKGAHAMMDGLDAERLMLAANQVGMAMAAWEETLSHLLNRDQGGILAYKDVAVKDMSKMYKDIANIAELILDCADKLDKGYPLAPEKANRLYWTTAEVATAVTTRCMDFHGGDGTNVNFRIGQLYQDAFILNVGGGPVDPARMKRVAYHAIPGLRAHDKTRAQALKKNFKGSVDNDIEINEHPANDTPDEAFNWTELRNLHNTPGGS